MKIVKRGKDPGRRHAPCQEAAVEQLHSVQGNLEHSTPSTGWVGTGHGKHWWKLTRPS